MQQTCSDTTKIISSLDKFPLPTGPMNDDSNPQQGSGNQPSPHPASAINNPERRIFKIPPTKRDERKLFVGGLPANITEQEFRDFFAQFGALVDSVVMFDRETRRSRGFGFVTYEDPAVCRRLLSSGGGNGTVGRLEMQGKTCEIKSAQPKEKSFRNSHQQQQPQQQQQQQHQQRRNQAEFHHQNHPHHQQLIPPGPNGINPQMNAGYANPMMFPPGFHHPAHGHPQGMQPMYFPHQAYIPPYGVPGGMEFPHMMNPATAGAQGPGMHPTATNAPDGSPLNPAMAGTAANPQPDYHQHHPPNPVVPIGIPVFPMEQQQQQQEQQQQQPMGGMEPIFPYVGGFGPGASPVPLSTAPPPMHHHHHPQPSVMQHAPPGNNNSANNQNISNATH